jgi:hypothetical protein
MQFEFKGRSATSGRQPYYCDNATIVEAKQNFDRGYSDMSLELTLDIGKAWQPRLFIDSKFAKNEDGIVTGPGTAFKIGEVFSRLGIDVVLEHGIPIDPIQIAALVGKKVWYLRYVSKNDKNEIKYRYLDTIQNGDWAGGKDNLIKAFLKRWDEKGQPAKYNPSLVSGEVTFEAPKNEAKEETIMLSDLVKEVSDLDEDDDSPDSDPSF